VDASNPAGADGVYMTADDGLRLSISSPCINAGMTANDVPVTDVLGLARISLPDMGAYEFVNFTGPNAPKVTATMTSALRAIWSWTSGGGWGNGTFAFKLDSTSGTWTTTKATSWSPVDDLSPGSHTLYVRERDDAGNWSPIGKYTIQTLDAASDWREYR